MLEKFKTYFIKTFGCQMNEADSERLAAVMEEQGYKLAQTAAAADVVIVNTCSVRESAENRVFGSVHNLTKLKMQNSKRKTTTQNSKLLKPKIILTGCMLGSAVGERRRYKIGALRRRLPGVDEFIPLEKLIGESGEAKRKRQDRALVPIMRGCDHFCSYCVVPYARGEEKSRSFNEIVCEAEALAKRGYHEIMLLGQNVNSFGKNLRPRRHFADLLRRLHKISGLKKISFMTSNPWDLTDELISALTLPKIDRTLHLPVQSGDDQVLKRMNRPYTATDYLLLVKKIRRAIPGIQISTDIIVGFPGETKAAFQNTVALCKKVDFVKAYISRYSLRPGTAAAKWKDNVSPAEKKRRWLVLNKLINKNT